MPLSGVNTLRMYRSKKAPRIVRDIPTPLGHNHVEFFIPSTIHEVKPYETLFSVYTEILDGECYGDIQILRLLKGGSIRGNIEIYIKRTLENMHT